MKKQRAPNSINNSNHDNIDARWAHAVHKVRERERERREKEGDRREKERGEGVCFSGMNTGNQREHKERLTKAQKSLLILV